MTTKSSDTVGSAPLADFPAATNDLCTSARSFVRFWVDRASHPDWPEVTRGDAEWTRLNERAQQIAESYWETCRDGRVTTPDERAQVHKASADAQRPLNAAENRLADAWQEARAPRFRKLHRQFGKAFARHELMLAGLLDTAGRRYGSWTGTSACEVLMRIADKILAVIDAPEVVFDTRGLDWDQLHNDLRCELGELARRSTITPNPNEKATSHATKKDDPSPLDVVNDPRCVAIRHVLADSPRTLQALERDRRIPASRRVITIMLQAMRTVGLIKQTKNRGPWCLTDLGRAQQAKDGQQSVGGQH